MNLFSAMTVWHRRLGLGRPGLRCCSALNVTGAIGTSNSGIPGRESRGPHGPRWPRSRGGTLCSPPTPTNCWLQIASIAKLRLEFCCISSLSSLHPPLPPQLHVDWLFPPPEVQQPLSAQPLSRGCFEDHTGVGDATYAIFGSVEEGRDWNVRTTRKVLSAAMIHWIIDCPTHYNSLRSTAMAPTWMH